MNLAQSGIVLLLALVATAASWSAESDVAGAQIRLLGLEARLEPDVRDDRLRELVARLRGLNAEQVHALQDDFQYALLLSADPEIYNTLDPQTIAAIDDGLEGIFDLADIDQDNHWEPLVYVYGFFNRDVTPELIRDVLARWNALSDSEKAPRYPTYIHVIDAVCKPLSMGPLAERDSTREALELVITAMKQQFLLPPAPGTAFHPPSHACLVLGPLYERWVDDPEFGTLVREHLGTRNQFETMLASQLPGAPGKEPQSHVVYGYYAYIGSYLANTLARLDARSAVPVLQRSLAIYQENDAKGRVVEYTRRALLALDDRDARSAFEAQLDDPAQLDTALATAAWLARNGQGETADYGRKQLGMLLQCTPEEALAQYFQREADSLK